MALHILKNPADMPQLEGTYHRYATVSLIRRTGLGKLISPRAGSVYVSAYSDNAYPLYYVAAPKWKGGQGVEWESLRQCYRKVLQLAVKDRCRAVILPLLAAEEPDFPASIDYKIAVDTIREFLDTNTLAVYLRVTAPEAAQLPQLHRDLRQILSSRPAEDLPQWSAEPFGADEDRFTTVTPGNLDMSVESGSESWGEEEELPEGSQESCGWEEEDAQPRPKKAAGQSFPSAAHQDSASYQKADVSRRDTGSLPDFLGSIELDAGFSETLLNLIDKTGKKDSEIYNKANVSRQHFSKIRNNPDYRPSKSTAVAFAIALELNLEQTEDLIGRAGYRLTRSSKFDVIIMYFIEKRNYNMFAINEVLYEYDQSLLGA